jgi:hypothetical protein
MHINDQVLKSTIRGVPRGDAQDARAFPLVMRRDEAVGNKKKNKSLFT